MSRCIVGKKKKIRFIGQRKIGKQIITYLFICEHCLVVIVKCRGEKSNITINR